MPEKVDFCANPMAMVGYFAAFVARLESRRDPGGRQAWRQKAWTRMKFTAKNQKQIFFEALYTPSLLDIQHFPCPTISQ